MIVIVVVYVVFVVGWIDYMLVFGIFSLWMCIVCYYCNVYGCDVSEEWIVVIIGFFGGFVLVFFVMFELGDCVVVMVLGYLFY